MRLRRVDSALSSAAATALLPRAAHRDGASGPVGLGGGLRTRPKRPPPGYNWGEATTSTPGRRGWTSWSGRGRERRRLTDAGTYCAHEGGQAAGRVAAPVASPVSGLRQPVAEWQERLPQVSRQ